MTASVLKFIAMITMLIDHIGCVLFPDVVFLRIIGRLAFPIYAYLIGEGCRYSKNKKKYLRNIALTFGAFQTVHFVVSGHFKLCVLFGFSLAVLFSIVFEWSKKCGGNRYLFASFVGAMLLTISLVAMPDYYIFCFTLPLTSYLINNKYLRLLVFGIQLVLMCFLWYIQIYALFSLILLFLYNGKQGKMRCKALFYVFYPLHYAILGLIASMI